MTTQVCDEVSGAGVLDGDDSNEWNVVSTR